MVRKTEMEAIKIVRTESTPEVNFDFSERTFSLQGMSFMEDVTSFYGPLYEKLSSFFQAASGEKIQFSFMLSYFNSSSTRAILQILQVLDEAGEENLITITWDCGGDEDIAEEAAELCEDLENVKFELTGLDD